MQAVISAYIIFLGNKSLQNLMGELHEKHIDISYPIVDALLEDMGFSLQQNRKCIKSGEADPDHDRQFRFINAQ